jgi:serine protease inhibitor
MESLAKNYYASAFTGDPESDEYNKYFKEWLNKQTGEQLSDFIGGLELDPQMLLTIASTVNYMGKWNYPFSKENTSSETFHAPSGDKECEFMKETMDLSYAWSDKFASIALSLENNGSMRFLLPDEGVSIEELMQDEAAVALLEGKYSRDFRAPETTQKPYDTAYVKVNMSIPKFDLSSTIDLKDNLKQMGITDAFDGTIADFTPLGDDTKGTFLSEALQSSRVAIDEAGCTASSLTVMMYAGAAMPTDEVDFVLDRPFVFEIMGETGLPLFVGVVNQI